MTEPLVSLCVPTRNRAEGLARGLASTCGQDYERLEILISDNASDDDTERVCREMAAADSRIRYVRQRQNIGLYGNHNFCLDESRGEFICFFHDHDDRDRSIVSRYVRFMKEHPTVGVVCSDWNVVSATGEHLDSRDRQVPSVVSGLEFINRTFASGRSSLNTPGSMIRKSALGNIRFDEHAPIGFGDFIIWFQIAERHAIGHINERLWGCLQDQHSESARTIESLTHDYDINMTMYCDAHLGRWPEHSAHVRSWRAAVPRYLFWALMYELGLYFRYTDGQVSGTESEGKTLFEIFDYRLSDEQFSNAITKLQTYRTGVLQRAAFATVKLLIHLEWTQPLVWATRYHASIRSILGLR